NNTAPPSDAIVLFDGKNLDEWVLNRDKSPAKWTVANGVLTVNKEKGIGNIETKRTFKNYQLHIEWKVPDNITGTGQARGNSGVLVQNHTELKGETLYIGKPVYKKYDTAPIKLQAHGDKSEPVSFRNIWVRELK